VPSLSVAMLTWEYPPVIVGGLARHVYELAGGLANQGHTVTVYTRARNGIASEVTDRGVRVRRVELSPPVIPVDDLIAWSLAFNLALLDRAARDLAEDPPDLVHAHDWLVAHAGVSLKALAGVPLVATIHATEHGRHRGRLAGSVQRSVNELERWLVTRADRVICCSAYMREEVVRVLDVPPESIDIIPNQVDMGTFSPEASRGPRAELVRDGLPLIVFAGRLEYEKGVQTILEALPLIDRLAPGVALAVAGSGTHRPALEGRAMSLGLDGRVRFLGFVDEQRLRGLYAAADLVVVPSLYEPFGLVALEAMASGTPVLVSDTGGLREIVDHEATGLRFVPGSASSLASEATRLLTDRKLAHRLAARAREAVAARAPWSAMATRTLEVYRGAIGGERPAGSAPLRRPRERSL
jgi:glycogen synthase